MSTALEVTGEVTSSKRFTFDELKRLPGQVADVGALLPGREGQGVRLASILAAAGPGKEAAYMTLSTGDGAFSASVPRAIVAERGIVVYALNGQPLPEAKGGPVRFYIQDVDSCGVADLDQCANVKHLARIELSRTPGRDVRPKTKKAHDALHEREKGQ